jgi:hypothetical protein
MLKPANGNVAAQPRRKGATVMVVTSMQEMTSRGYAIIFALDRGGYPAAERETQSARHGL